MDPSLLCKWPTLRHLHLCELELDLGPGDDSDDSDDINNDPALKNLLTSLCSLTKLQDLELFNMYLSSDVDLQHYSALTASPHLTVLRITDSTIMPVPAQALHHVLPAGKRMLPLQVLELDGAGWSDTPFASRQISLIPACCTALSSLGLLHVVDQLATIGYLKELRPCLESLRVAGDAFDDEAAAVVAQLTNLRNLEWKEATITDRGFQQLTALRGLTHLLVEDCVYATVVDETTFSSSPEVGGICLCCASACLHMQQHLPTYPTVCLFLCTSLQQHMHTCLRLLFGKVWCPSTTYRPKDMLLAPGC